MKICVSKNKMWKKWLLKREIVQEKVKVIRGDEEIQQDRKQQKGHADKFKVYKCERRIEKGEEEKREVVKKPKTEDWQGKRGTWQHWFD